MFPIAERRKRLKKNAQRRVDIQMIGTKKNAFQLVLTNKFTELGELDDKTL